MHRPHPPCRNVRAGGPRLSRHQVDELRWSSERPIVELGERRFARPARSPGRSCAAQFVVVAAPSLRHAPTLRCDQRRSEILRQKSQLVAATHCIDLSFVDRASIGFPIGKKLPQCFMAVYILGETSQSEANCVRASAERASELVQELFIVVVQPDSCRTHATKCNTVVLHHASDRNEDLKDGGTISGCRPSGL